jgi:hypothetical protein
LRIFIYAWRSLVYGCHPRTSQAGDAEDASLNNRARIDRFWLFGAKINQTNAGAKKISGNPPAGVSSRCFIGPMSPALLVGADRAPSSWHRYQEMAWPLNNMPAAVSK